MQNRQRAGRDGMWGGVGGGGEGGKEKREGEGAGNYSLQNIGCFVGTMVNNALFSSSEYA